MWLYFISYTGLKIKINITHTDTLIMIYYYTIPWFCFFQYAPRPFCAWLSQHWLYPSTAQKHKLIQHPEFLCQHPEMKSTKKLFCFISSLLCSIYSANGFYKHLFGDYDAGIICLYFCIIFINKSFIKRNIKRNTASVFKYKWQLLHVNQWIYILQ